MIILNDRGQLIMKNQSIVFTQPNTAQLLESELDNNLSGNQVLIKTLYSAISAGTERDNLRGEPNLDGLHIVETTFPRRLGYSSSGEVLETGPECKRVKKGDKVIVCYGSHSRYQKLPETSLFPMLYEEITTQQAALFMIGSFPMEGVRKTRLEIGESAMVSGLGILGLFAVQFCRAAGAVPVIAVDPDPERRELALSLGADFAVNPTGIDLPEKIRSLTGKGGVNVAIDVSGRNEATIDSMRSLDWYGRITLLGCNRHPGVYDLYHLVHARGIEVIGANNVSRPKFESRPGCWTMEDDVNAIQRLVHGGRIKLEPLINEINSPEDAPQVFARLASCGKFPIGVLFDWNRPGNE